MVNGKWLLVVLVAAFVGVVVRFARLPDRTVVPCVQALCRNKALPPTIGFAMDIDTADGAFWETFRLAQYAAAPTALDVLHPHDTTLFVTHAKKTILATLHRLDSCKTLDSCHTNAYHLYLICHK